MSTLVTIPEKLKTRIDAARDAARVRFVALTEKSKQTLQLDKLRAAWLRATLRVRGALDLPSREALATLSVRVEKLAKRIESFEKKAEARVKQAVNGKKPQGKKPQA